MRVRIFIDFWNFQIHWNERAAGQCDWRALPAALLGHAEGLVASIGNTAVLSLEETHVYASVDPSSEAKLRNWLTGTIDRMPSYKVTIRERRPRPKSIHCRHCGADFDRCANCGERFAPRTEKGVDAAIVTDLLKFAFQRSYELGVLVTGDADFVPAVEYLQGQGVHVVNAGWAGVGHQLKSACWASFDLDGIVATVTR